MEQLGHTHVWAWHHLLQCLACLACLQWLAIPCLFNFCLRSLAASMDMLHDGYRSRLNQWPNSVALCKPRHQPMPLELLLQLTCNSAAVMTPAALAVMWLTYVGRAGKECSCTSLTPHQSQFCTPLHSTAARSPAEVSMPSARLHRCRTARTSSHADLTSTRPSSLVTLSTLVAPSTAT